MTTDEFFVSVIREWHPGCIVTPVDRATIRGEACVPADPGATNANANNLSQKRRPLSRNGKPRPNVTRPIRNVMVERRAASLERATGGV